MSDEESKQNVVTVVCEEVAYKGGGGAGAALEKLLEGRGESLESIR